MLYTFLWCITDTILKKYSSTVATIFTGIASAALFGHTLTINFILGISIVFISMHQVTESVFSLFGLECLLIMTEWMRELIDLSKAWIFFSFFSVQFFSPLSKLKDESQNGSLEMTDDQNYQRYDRLSCIYC